MTITTHCITEAIDEQEFRNMVSLKKALENYIRCFGGTHERKKMVLGYGIALASAALVGFLPS
jgi:hypothetical protein